ncbi:MAG: 4Fe-4S cluster-binding domain-containing protein [Tissierellia bacterium]|nr:4Fe-4S cluster-binding domain-containing protein [Tissierellia bacterium]
MHKFNTKNYFYVYLEEVKQAYKFETKEERQDFIEQDVEEILKDSEPLMSIGPKTRRGLFLNIANTCNMRCTYCFANQGNYGKKPGIMDSGTARKAVDYFIRMTEPCFQINIIFFGGEPLVNFPVIVETVNHVNKTYSNRDIKFHLVTNATLLSKKRIDFLSEHNFSLGVSIDGCREIQNKQRPLINGKDSYYETTKHLEYILKRMNNVHARGTYVDFNEPLVDAYRSLLKLGFREVSIPPDVLGCKNINQYERLEYQLDLLFEYIVDYANKTFTLPFGIYIESLRRLFMQKIDVEYTCGLGEDILSIDYNGNIYPCHRFSSEEKFKIGNIDDYVNTKELEFTSTICNACWNRYTCSHGCHYNDYILEKGENKKNPLWCKYAKKLTEQSIKLCESLPKELIEEYCLK